MEHGISTEKLGPDRRNGKYKGPEVPDMLTRAESGRWRSESLGVDAKKWGHM